jgi:hypothetical protein
MSILAVSSAPIMRPSLGLERRAVKSSSCSRAGSSIVEMLTEPSLCPAKKVMVSEKVT